MQIHGYIVALVSSKLSYTWNGLSHEMGLLSVRPQIEMHQRYSVLSLKIYEEKKIARVNNRIRRAIFRLTQEEKKNFIIMNWHGRRKVWKNASL